MHWLDVGLWVIIGTSWMMTAYQVLAITRKARAEGRWRPLYDEVKKQSYDNAMAAANTGIDSSELYDIWATKAIAAYYRPRLELFPNVFKPFYTEEEIQAFTTPLKLTTNAETSEEWPEVLHG